MAILPKNEVYLNKSTAQKALKENGYNKFDTIDGQTIYKSEKNNNNLFPNSESYTKLKELKVIKNEFVKIKTIDCIRKIVYHIN